MKRIDLNVDIGEGFAHDLQLLTFATSANICCGVHAGSWELTQDTIGLALDAGARIGMHPGYPDRESMGRAPWPRDVARRVRHAIVDQVERFFNFVPAAYLKPHGALYHDALDPSHPAARILRLLCGRYRVALMGMPGTPHEELSETLIREGFADRRYLDSGLLAPRSEPGAVLTDPEMVSAQVLRLAPMVDSICLHGDTPDCLVFAELVFRTLFDAGYEVGP